MGRPHPPQSGIELEEFFDLSIDLLCIVGFDGYFKRVNASLERTLGYPKPELYSLSVFDITHPDDVEPSREALGRLAEGHDLVGFEARVICGDGSVRWLEWNTRTMPERGVVYGVARDTTERRRAEAELGEAHRMLEARRDELRMLAEEQAALRRVATLVARETPPDEVFAAVAREVGEILGVDATHLGRYDPDGTVVSVAQWGRYPGVPVGARFPLEGDNVSTRVLRTGRPARMDGYADAPGVIAATVRQIGIRVSIAAPISVEGRTWGVMIATSKGETPFPAETESRLQNFTELLATAISNASAHDKVRVLADEQAALRRVATLVAQQTPQADVFRAVAEEIGRLLAVGSIEMLRYEEDRFGVVVASAGPVTEVIPIGTRAPLEGRNVASLVFQTGRAARLDHHREEATGPFAERLAAAGVRSMVGTPIMVERRLWGAMLAVTHDAPLPPDTESRIGQFTDLMATAVANAEARAEVARLADEQAALRRVATLVAQGAPPSAVFDAVTGEVAELLDVSAVSLARYEDDVLTVVAQRGVSYVQIGERFPVGGANVTSTVLRTRRTARLDDFAQATGPIGDLARRAGVRSVVAAPVVVDGRIWGMLAAIWTDHGPPPDDTEERMATFAELLDTAIANADSRVQLTASRARVLAAGDDARRRVVRDLHDGAQQRLVHTVVTLQLAQQAFNEDPGDAEAFVAQALSNAEQATAELRELARGILPFVLTHGGLRAGVDAVVARLDLPVDVDVLNERLPPDIEASAYFIVAEALTNVVKHARATRATVTAAVDDGVLTLQVRDDGVGGANPEGHGLVGIADRVDALGGRLRIESTHGEGTVLAAWLPSSTGWPRGSERR
ncbi:GAF domain-containing protein [Candidatus Solirubrobacter pratensis]|uniref:GAF domain-containing protein n=1 Tax=Candidatus Solirubrobacter pratensis TaxID=1298857 RepID=UPI000407AE0A|nr:GAF domain-containing protein [Candidatus Solirubrobacter pratensis]